MNSQKFLLLLGGVFPILVLELSKENLKVCMRERDLITCLNLCMVEETMLMDDFSQMLIEMRSFLMKRSWTDLEESMNSLGTVGDRMNLIEKERVQLFGDLKSLLRVRDDSGFQQVVSHISNEEDKALLSESFRKLRLATVKSQAICEGIGFYTRTKSQAVMAILDEVIPVRRGKLYSRHGKPTEAESSALFLNHRR